MARPVGLAWFSASFSAPGPAVVSSLNARFARAPMRLPENGATIRFRGIAMPFGTARRTSRRHCWCGKADCIETWLSGPGLALSYRTQTERIASAKEIAQRAADGEAEAEAVLTDYENLLARALATVVNVLDPDAIVLGGGLSNIDRLYRNVPRLWQDWAFSDRIDTPLLAPMHGDSSGVRGAAWLWDTP